MTRSFELKVGEDQEGQRLDSFIAASSASRGHELTRSQVKSLIERGLVRLDGQPPAKAGLALQAGQVIKVEIPAPKKLDLSPRDVGIRILHEDEDIAVLDKPAGISVHPSPTEQAPTVVHGLLHQLRSLSSVGGVERPGIVHRIDKGTSGILVVSKTDQAHLALSRQFKDHSIDRRYLALVYGDLSKKGKSGRIETFYGRNPKHRKKMTGKLSEGRKAITNWRCIETFGSLLTHVECRLETGRTHQIRVHLSELGFPIVGDPLYCDNERKSRGLIKSSRELSELCGALDHQLLHACYLEFEHPRLKTKIRFESTAPADFAKVLESARLLKE